MDQKTHSGGWNFYCGYNHSLPNVEPQNIQGVKMWRKDYFARLLEKAKEYGIVVEVAE